jgi:hypothetical protein
MNAIAQVVRDTGTVVPERFAVIRPHWVAAHFPIDVTGFGKILVPQQTTSKARVGSPEIERNFSLEEHICSDDTVR